MKKNFKQNLIFTIFYIILLNYQILTNSFNKIENYYRNCQISDVQLQQLTPKELQKNGGWDLGYEYIFIQDIKNQNQINKIQLSDDDFIQGYNKQFEQPQIFIGEQQYRPQIRNKIKQFHKRNMECNYGGKLVTVIPSNSFKNDFNYQNDQLLFKQILNDNANQNFINLTQELSDLQQQLTHILEGNNYWQFLDDYDPIQGKSNNISLYFGYGKKNQSSMFKEYKEQYQELLYGEKLWLMVPTIYVETLNQNIQFKNIIEFIEKGYHNMNELQIVIQMPGDIIYIPDQWSAATLNIGEVLYIGNINNIEQKQNQLYQQYNKEDIIQSIAYAEKMQKQNIENEIKPKKKNSIHENNQQQISKQVDYIQPFGNTTTEGSNDYHVQCNLTKQELIDQMDPQFKDNGGWDPSEIYEVLKNIDYTTEDVERVELSDEEFLEGLDIHLDYPRIFKSKSHKYRPQVRDILHLFSKQYMLCSYSKRTISLSPCYGELRGGFKDVLLEDWLEQSEKEKYDVTLEELQELEGEQFFNLFGGTLFPFVEFNYETVWKYRKDKIQKLLGYGKSGSGVPFHKHQEVFNEVIYGQKLWFLTPPCHDFEFNEQGMSIKFFNQELYKQKGVVVILQQPGEILYLPKFWYHSTLNIGETLCVASFNDGEEQMNDDLFFCGKNDNKNDVDYKDLLKKQNKSKTRLECDPSNIDECWEVKLD